MKRLSLVLLAVGCLWAGPENSFVIRGATVHPVSGPEIVNATVVVTDGKIAEVGARAGAPRGHKVIEGKGLHVYPGMIDAASVMGLSEIGSVRETQDVTELGDFNPQLRTVIAINPSSEHIAVTRSNGITTSVVTPAGGMIGGQASIVHLDGWTWEEMAVERSAAMQMRMPTSEQTFSTRLFGPARRPFPEVKRRYEENMQKLRQFFEQARAYQKAKANPVLGFKPELRFEAMLPVLEGKKPVIMAAQRERAIRDSLAFADEQKLKVILAGPREVEPFIKELAEKKIAVILPDHFTTPLDEDAAIEDPLNMAAKLHQGGVKVLFGSYDIMGPRNIPFQAANAVAHGLPLIEAWKGLTMNAAEVFGVADRIGSVEKGKVADLILADGDPLEPRTQIRQIWIAGKSVSLKNRHTRLYEQYKKRF